MTLRVYDFRKDIANNVITPDLRCRFYYMEPGRVDARHSHDLGHEVFLVLQGKCQMEVEGDTVILEPGQMCMAYRDQMHQASNPFDEPMIMYLSVTPHVEPTHTRWEDGKKAPWRYGNAAAKEREAAGPPTEALASVVDRQNAAARDLARAASALADRGEKQSGELTGGDAKAAADRIWADLYRTRRALETLELTWNELAPRTMP